MAITMCYKIGRTFLKYFLFFVQFFCSKFVCSYFSNIILRSSTWKRISVALSTQCWTTTSKQFIQKMSTLKKPYNFNFILMTADCPFFLSHMHLLCMTLIFTIGLTLLNIQYTVPTMILYPTNNIKIIMFNNLSDTHTRSLMKTVDYTIRKPVP